VTWLFLLLAMSVIAVVAALVTGRIGGGMDAPVSSLPFRGLPPEAVNPGDLETLRFSPALRGYRMDEVDQVLDRLGTELRRRDDEIARLDGQLGALQHRLGGPQQAVGEYEDAAARGGPDGYEAAYQAAYGPGFATGQIPLHGSGQPGHDQPGHDQPGHDQPGHDQPAFDHSGPDHAGRDRFGAGRSADDRSSGAQGAELGAEPGRPRPGPS